MNVFHLHACVLILLSLFASNLAQVRPVDEEDQGGTCSTLVIPRLCDGVGYTNIYLPNFRGHTTQSNAAAELDDFTELLDSGCSPSIRLFFCSFYLPLCFMSALDSEPHRLRPCRSLCEEARSNCSEVLEQNSNFTWPLFMDCSLDTFPCGVDATCFGTAAPCSLTTTIYQPTTTTISVTANGSSPASPTPRATESAVRVVSSLSIPVLLCLLSRILSF